MAMADTKNFAFGMRVYSEGGQGRPRMQEYPVPASKTIYKGDPVMLVAGGTVETQDTVDAVTCIGVAAHYVAVGAGAVGVVLVYNDPATLFVMQEDSLVSSLGVADVGFNGDFINLGDESVAGTRISGVQADSDSFAAAAAHPLKVVGFNTRINNAAGDNYSEIIVMFNAGYHLLNTGLGI